MTKHVASGWLGILCGATLLAAGCTRIDPKAEVQQAATHVEQATGTAPPWASDERLELQPDESGTVPLEQAVNLALANNRALRADLEVIGQAKADLVQAGLLHNPILSIMVRFPEAGGRSMFDFGVMQELSDLWLIPSRKRAAQAMLQQRLLTFSDTAIALVSDVKTGYYAHQYQALAIDLQQQNLGLIREAIEVAQVRLRAGQAGALDVNLLQSRLLETELELLQLRSEQRVTQQSLLRLMGVAQASVTWYPQPLLLDAQTATLPEQESDLVDAALEQRLDVQAAEWELEAAAAEFQQEMLKLLPSLSVGLAGERTERRAPLDRKIWADTLRESILAGKPTIPQFETPSQRRLMKSREIRLLLGPALEVPLPVFDQNQAQVAKAQYRARELIRRYEELVQRIIEGVRSAVAQRRLAEDKVRFYRQSLVPLQEANLQLAQTDYQGGRESILTVLLVQEELIRTRLAYAAAVRDLLVNTANLERQLAGRLPEASDEPPTSQPADESVEEPR
jgi:cobalt-zinc-cadmium efflux system outer membrane protein